MSARVQGLVLGLGKAKQADIATASASYIRFVKNNMDLTSTGLETENDKDEIGKGTEFISPGGVFLTAYKPGNRIQKYCSAEFLTWALAYGLGGVAEATGVYTLTPIDPGTTLELPYFSVVEQIPEGGGSAIDNGFIGAALNSLTLNFASQPGRASATVDVEWMGSGKLTQPSAVSVPATTAEHYMLAQSMALTINGVNYVTNKNIISGSFGWVNNLILGYFPGAGLQNGAALAGRIEIGNRVPSFQFVSRLQHDSDEYSKLIAQTTGTIVLTLTFDATHTVTITFNSVSYANVNNGESNGIVSTTTTVDLKNHASLGVVSVTAKCGITGIAQ